MKPWQEELEDLANKLATQRDEIKVQLHLAGAELNEEWDKLEATWEQFKFKGDKVLQEVESTSDEVADTLSLLGEELKEGYQRIKDRLR